MTQPASLSTAEQSSKSWKHPDSLLYTQEPAPTEEPPRYQNMASLFPDWHLDARCAGESEAIFFGSSDPEVRPTYTLGMIKQARKLCSACPVARECLKAALMNKEEYGVWAGSTRKQRRKMLVRLETGISSVETEIEHHVAKLTSGITIVATVTEVIHEQ